MLCQLLVTAFCCHLSPCAQLPHQCRGTAMSRLGITVVCTHVSCRKPILGDSHVTLLPHPLLHLITLADGIANISRQEEVTGEIGAKWTCWCAEGDSGPSIWVPRELVKLVPSVQTPVVTGPNRIKWYQFRNQKKGRWVYPNGYAEMRFLSREGGFSLTLSGGQSYHHVGVWNPSPRLEGRTLPLVFLTSSGTQLLSTHTGLNPYMMKPFRGLGEVRKWWRLGQRSVLHSDVLMLIYKSF